jgi:hypothetical protein
MSDFTVLDDKEFFVFGYVNAVDPISTESYIEYQILDSAKRQIRYDRDKERLRREFNRILKEGIFQRTALRVGTPVDGWSVEVVITVNGFGEELSRYYQVVDPLGMVRGETFATESEAEAVLLQYTAVVKLHGNAGPTFGM